MKALLQKDFYLLKAYCKSYLLICAVFFAVSLVGSDNLFFITYPAMLCSLIPVTLQTYDERSGWTTYAGTLPFTKAQLVSAKYLTGLCCSGFLWVLLALILLASPHYSAELRLLLLELTLCLSLAFPAFCLPFVFRLGTEKGRMAYYVSIGVFCAVTYILAEYLGISAESTASAALWSAPAAGLLSNMAGACALSAALYALSWMLSIRIYEKREIS